MFKVSYAWFVNSVSRHCGWDNNILSLTKAYKDTNGFLHSKQANQQHVGGTLCHFGC